MSASGVCCGSLENPKTLMKMGLSVITVGHVNFLLGVLVHGVVLRHINLHKQARALEYAISNVVALSAGMVAIVVGVMVIVLSKNKRSRCLVWFVFVLSLASALLAAASAVGLLVSVVRAIVHGGQSLLAHCRFPDAIGYSSVTNECPFDPTRIYSTTLILWVPLIVTCIIQLVFSARCFAACVSFLDLPCCPPRKRSGCHIRETSVMRPVKEGSRSLSAEPPRSHSNPAKLHAVPPRYHHEPVKQRTDPPRGPSEAPRWTTAPANRQLPSLPPRDPPRQHRHPPPSEMQPLRPTHRGGSDRERSGTRAGSQRSAPEQHQLLERRTLERSSFWI